MRNNDLKKTIIFVATTPFAVNAFLRNHLLALSEDFDIKLCVNTHAYPLSADLAEKLQIIHVNIGRKINIWTDLCALINLVIFFIRLHPCVVHSITPKGGLLAMLAAWLTLVPSRSHTFTGQVWATQKGWRRIFLKFFDRLIVIFSTRVFSDSHSQCNFLQEENIIWGSKISVLGPGSIAGVDIAQFKFDDTTRLATREKNDVPLHKCIYLFVGRLVMDKGVFDLIDAFILVERENPEVELWIVGPDEDGILHQLKKKANSVNNKVRWFGPTTTPEKFMVAADILILPSYREGFGSVVIEAAACGIPAIAYSVTGVIDAIVHGDTGLLTTVGNSQDLAEKMLMLSRDHVKRKMLGSKALDRATNQYSSILVTSAWIEYFSSEVIKSKAHL